MEYPISRLYQIQKRIQEAISDLLPEYNKTLQRRVTNLLGTPEERQALLDGFNKSDAALERYQQLNELPGSAGAHDDSVRCRQPHSSGFRAGPHKEPYGTGRTLLW